MIFINIKRGGFSLREITIIALLAALATAARIGLMAIPDAKPTSFIVISAGMMMGGGVGFTLGCIIALISNVFLSLGPWLPWQMALWGFMGFMSPLVRGRHRIIQASYGFAWGFIYGWIMNIWYFADGMAQFSLNAYFISCANSFYFDLIHAITNAALLAVFSDGWLKQLMVIAKLQTGRSEYI